MNRFLKESDERLLDLKRNTESKRGGRGSFQGSFLNNLTLLDNFLERHSGSGCFFIFTRSRNLQGDAV
jgi:hypothetical protein